MAKNKKILLLIDAHALIHRAYHALYKADMSDSSGRPAGAVYGFTSILIKALKDIQPDYVAAAFDLAETTIRKEAYKDYKATRAKTDDELIQQVPTVRKVLKGFGIPVVEHAGFEADDVIGTLAERTKEKEGIQTVILTGDLDTLQLVDDDKVVVYTMRRGMSDTIIYNEESVRERYGGLAPQQLPDYKGLKGDSSDNIPGVKGMGKKRAITALSRHETLEELYEHFEEDDKISTTIKNKLRDSRQEALFSKELGTIRCDAPVAFSLNEARFVPAEIEGAKAVLASLGFKSLVQRIKNDLKGTEEDGEKDGAPQQNIDHHKDKVDELYEQNLFSKKIYEIERALAPVLIRMQERGVRVDTSLLNKLNTELTNELSSIETTVQKYVDGEINLNSPKEVGELLFETLGIAKSKAKKTKTGAYSTRAEVLEDIKDEHKVVPLILRWRELAKLTSTYLEPLVELVAEDGRIHTTYKQFGTVTGRLSSENPNLQNIPIKGEYGEQIRAAFVASEGFEFLAADYSQIELRIAAALSKDPKMLETFRRGGDIHTRTAAEVNNVALEEVSKEMRRQAKILNFGILYGMGSRAFAKSAEVPHAQAKRFIDEYEEGFSGLTRYIQDLKKTAYRQGYIETAWGRRRNLPELSSANPGMRAAGERMAVNMPIQGTAADVIKAAMVTLDTTLQDDEDIRMVLQVHDELIFEIAEGTQERYIPLVREAMEGVIDLSVPLTIDIEIGPNWGAMKPISKH